MIVLRQTSKGHGLLRLHDDVIKWKHFPRYWAFVRGIHRSPVDSPHKDHWRGALIFLSARDSTVKQTVETPVIWDAIALIMTSLYCRCNFPMIYAHGFVLQCFVGVLSAVLRILRSWQNGWYLAKQHYENDFLLWVWLVIWFKFKRNWCPNYSINNKPTLVEIMTWRRTDDKSLPEPRMAWFADAYMRHSATWICYVYVDYIPT